MSKIKLLIFTALIFCIIPTVFASDWPPPYLYPIKFNIDNQTNDTFLWKYYKIPFGGQNPISANSNVTLNGATTEYTPQGTILISNVNNSAEYCLAQDGIYASSYVILKNAIAGSGFTCVINNGSILIQPISSNQ